MSTEKKDLSSVNTRKAKPEKAKKKKNASIISKSARWFREMKSELKRLSGPQESAGQQCGYRVCCNGFVKYSCLCI